MSRALLFLGLYATSCSGQKTKVVLLHPHGADTQAVLQDAAAKFNADNADAEVSIAEAGWGDIFGALVANNTCYNNKDAADTAERCNFVEPDVAITTVGNTWSADLYDKGVLTSIQEYLDDWRARRRGGDVTRDFVRNLDLDYVFPKDKNDPNGAGVNEWYTLPFDVGTRVMFWRPDLYRTWLDGRTNPPDDLDELTASSKTIIQRMEADETVSLWKVCNAADTLWAPTVTGITAYSDEACTTQINIAGHRCDVGAGSGSACTLPRSLDCSSGSGIVCAADAACIGFELTQNAIVRCVDVATSGGRNLGTSNATVDIAAGTAGSVTHRTDTDAKETTFAAIGLVVSGGCCEDTEDAYAGIQVVSVEEGLAAHQSGLRSGMPVSNYKSVAALSSALQGGGSVSIRIEPLSGGVNLARYRASGDKAGWRMVDTAPGSGRVTNARTWGFPLPGGGGSSTVMQSLHTFVFGMGSEFVSTGAACPYTTPRFRAALKAYTDTYLQRDTNKLNPAPELGDFGGRWDACSGYFGAGKAIHIMGASWFYGALHKGGWGAGTLEVSQVGVAPVPAGSYGRFSFLGGSGWAIPSYVSRAKKDVAWRFMELAFDPAGEFLPEAVFRAHLIPAYESVLVRSQSRGLCGDMCRNVTASLPFAVPLHYPQRGFFKMARLEANFTVQWMVQQINGGADINRTTEIGHDWFVYETTKDNVEITPAPSSSSDSTILIVVIVVVCVIAAGAFVAVVIVYRNMTAEQRRIGAMLNANAIAAEMADAVGHLDFESEAIHHLEAIEKPDRVQTALRAILKNMKVFVRYIPQHVIRAVRGDDDDDDDEQLDQGSKKSAQPARGSHTKQSSRSSIGSKSSFRSRATAAGAGALKKSFETRTAQVTVIVVRRVQQCSLEDAPFQQNEFAKGVLDAFLAEKALVHRLAEDCVIGTWGAVGAVRGKSRVCNVADRCHKVGGGGAACGISHEKAICASVGNDTTQYYAVLGPIIDRTEQFARVAAVFRCPGIMAKALAGELLNFCVLSPFFTCTTRDGAATKLYMLLSVRRQQEEDEWMYQLEKQEAEASGAAELTLPKLIESVSTTQDVCAARDSAREFAKQSKDPLALRLCSLLCDVAVPKLGDLCVQDAFPFTACMTVSAA